MADLRASHDRGGMDAIEPLEAIVGTTAGIVALCLELATVVALAIGAIVAIFGMVKGISNQPFGNWQREVWLRFAGWTVVALEFALAADIVRTTYAPSWDEIGKLAVIAVVRTVLNFFLGRDLEAVKAPDGELNSGG